MLRIAVVEDEPATCRLLQDYISRFQSERKAEIETTAFSNGLDLVEDFRPIWDVILLDIEMPIMDGMTAARHIRKADQDVAIIFITNMAKYAIKGYEVNALDFVLKPVSYFAFAMKLDKVVARLSRQNHSCLLLQTEGRMVRLSAEEITYIEVIHHRLQIHTEEQDYTASGTLTTMEERLREEGFVRCNKGYLVNLRHVKRIYADSVLVGNERLLISRRKREEFLAAVTDYYGGGGR